MELDTPHQYVSNNGKEHEVPQRSKFSREFNLAISECVNFKMCQNSNFCIYCNNFSGSNFLVREKAKISSHLYFTPL